MKSKQSFKRRIMAIAIAVIMVTGLLAPVSPVYAEVPPGWTEVKTASELKTALEDATTTQVMLGADITVPKGNIYINNKKPSLVIDGNGYTLSEFSDAAIGYITLSSNGSFTSITFQNMNMVGKTVFSTFYTPKEVIGVTITYKNVKFIGPTLGFHKNSFVRLIDSDFITKSISGYSFLTTTTVCLEGNINIDANTNDIFNFTTTSWETPKGLTVAKGANVNISNTRDKGACLWMDNSTVRLRLFDQYIRFEEDSYFNYVGKNCFQYGETKELTIGERAQVYITTYGDFNRLGFGIFQVTGDANINKDAVLDIRAFDNTEMFPAFRVAATGNAYFNNPKEVFIYNSSTWPRNGGLAIGPYVLSPIDDIYFNDVSSIEYWKLNTNKPDNLPEPTKDFRNSDGSLFSSKLIVDVFAAATLATSSGYTGALAFNTANATLTDINVLRVNGSPDVEKSAPPLIDTVMENAAEVTGAGVPDAAITVTFPDGSTVNATVDSGGTWLANVPNGVVLSVGDVISAVQQETGKLVSDAANTTVVGNPMPDPDIDLYIENLTTGRHYANAGDTLLYDVVLSNKGTASSTWRSAYVTFELNENAALQVSSIRINNRAVTSSQYTYDSTANTLTLYLGDIPGGGSSGSSVSISFRTIIGSDIGNIDDCVLGAILGSLYTRSIIYSW